jgi:hypothetical protein
MLPQLLLGLEHSTSWWPIGPMLEQHLQQSGGNTFLNVQSIYEWFFRPIAGTYNFCCHSTTNGLPHLRHTADSHTWCVCLHIWHHSTTHIEKICRVCTQCHSSDKKGQITYFHPYFHCVNHWMDMILELKWARVQSGLCGMSAHICMHGCAFSGLSNKRYPFTCCVPHKIQ